MNTQTKHFSYLNDLAHFWREKIHIIKWENAGYFYFLWWFQRSISKEKSKQKNYFLTLAVSRIARCRKLSPKNGHEMILGCLFNKQP